MEKDAENAMHEMDKAYYEAAEIKRLEQLEKDKNALLTLNSTELKKYQDKRKKEIAEEEKKMKEFAKKLETRLKINKKKK